MLKSLLKEILTNTGPKLYLSKNKIKKKSILGNINIRSFGNKNSDKIFYIIKRYPGAGLFSNVTYVLNQIKICKLYDFIPIVDMENYPTIYNESEKIQSSYNAWNYYFNSLNKFSLKEVYKSKNVFFSSGKFENYMLLDMTHKSISHFFKYINIKKKFFTIANSFANRFFNKNDKILGVHFRGSTYKVARKHAFPPTKKIMFENVLYLLKKYKFNKIFLVTEEVSYLNYFKSRLGDKCLYTEQYRMLKKDSFKIYPRPLHRYKLGKETLIDTILLSKCDGVTYIKSNIISASILLSKKKQKLHEIFLGRNSSNKYLSNWLWHLKSKLPSKIGGLKIIAKS